MGTSVNEVPGMWLQISSGYLWPASCCPYVLDVFTWYRKPPRQIEFSSVHKVLWTEKLSKLSFGTDPNVRKSFLLLLPIVGVGKKLHILLEESVLGSRSMFWESRSLR